MTCEPFRPQGGSVRCDANGCGAPARWSERGPGGSRTGNRHRAPRTARRWSPPCGPCSPVGWLVTKLVTRCGVVRLGGYECSPQCPDPRCPRSSRCTSRPAHRRCQSRSTSPTCPRRPSRSSRRRKPPCAGPGLATASRVSACCDRILNGIDSMEGAGARGSMEEVGAPALRTHLHDDVLPNLLARPEPDQPLVRVGPEHTVLIRTHNVRRLHLDLVRALQTQLASACRCCNGCGGR